MPIYEYECMACDHCFEYFAFPGRNPKPLISCPECESKDVFMIPSMIGLAMHNKEMITSRDGYKVRNKARGEKKDECEK